MKPRVLLTTKNYRLVFDGHWRTQIERGDGYDLMRNRRWNELTAEQKAQDLERVIDQIGDALLLRAKRRRKGGSRG